VLGTLVVGIVVWCAVSIPVSLVLAYALRVLSFERRYVPEPLPVVATPRVTHGADDAVEQGA
jgi:hypothetical protein